GVGLAGLVALTLAGCTALYRDHGWAPSDADLSQVVVGETTRDQVADIIGAPGTSGVLAGSGWYYVESRWEHFAYRAPKEIDREVVAISFADNGVVQNVERFGLEQGQVVALSRRVTDDNIQGITFLRQLFGSLGRIDPARMLRGRNP